MPRRGWTALLVIALAAGAAWLLFVGLPGWYAPSPSSLATPVAKAAQTPERKISATLYYVSEDGLSLLGVQRDVPFGEPVVEQARRIVEAQIAAAPAPLVSAVPAGTTLRALFVTERGDAFVDLSAEISTGHTGGTLDELFTVYAIVNALTVNLPAIARVQVLVDGREADTIAGHVDIRHPLRKNLKWIKTND